MHRPHRFPAYRALSLFAVCCLVASAAWASKTQRFVDDSFSDFQSGDTTTSTLSDQGFVTIPPLKKKVYSPAKTDVFWDAAAAPDGRVFLGSGHSGKLFVLDRNSSGSLVVKTSKLELYALEVEPDGSVLVGGAPGGSILKVSPDDKVTTFSKTGQEYVWAIRRYPGGALYAATGTKGKIFKIDDKGKATEYCTIKQAKNVLDLGFDSKGHLLAVTESKGMLVRIDGKGKAFVLYESDLDEIRRVAVSQDGDIWIAVNGQKSAGAKAGARGKGLSPAELALMIGGGGGPGDDSGPKPPMPTHRRPRGGPPGGGGGGAPAKIVLLSPEGFVRMSWDSPDSPIYDIALDQGGKQLYVAAGNNGGLYRLDRLGHSEKITAVREKGLVRLLRKSDGTLIALTNAPAVAYLIDPSKSTDGIFVSQVFDAQDPVRWGRALLEATIPSGSKVLFSTRSGNTGDPEHHWSEWSKKVEVVDAKTIDIKSPPARRIQYRLTMSAASQKESSWPRVDKVEIPYVSPNQPPEIKDVKVKAELKAAQRGGGGPGHGITLPSGIHIGGGEGAAGLMKLRSAAGGGSSKGNGGDSGGETVDISADSNAGKMTVTWKSDDPNDDDLESKVYIRPETDQSWVLLDENVKGNRYVIDSAALPDGRYRVKVVTSDLPSNLPSQALTAQAVSDPFEVDNTPPKIQNLASAAGEKSAVAVTFRAVDETTRITSAQWRINGKDWRFLSPKDGIFDSKTEEFEVNIPQKDFEGEKSAMVTVRATDERGNTGVGLIRVKVAP